jgi:hypothetical protein
MEEAVRLNAAELASTEADTESLPRCEHALELLLTHRGNPSAEVDRVLANDPQCVFAHCLCTALIVCADEVAARSSLAAAAIEAACPDVHDPARRHAAAARAWLKGGAALAVEHYGAIVINWPRDILALVVAHALDFRLGRCPTTLRDCRQTAHHYGFCKGSWYTASRPGPRDNSAHRR